MESSGSPATPHASSDSDISINSHSSRHNMQKSSSSSCHLNAAKAAVFQQI
jgi:hypothetical protein